MTAFIVAIAAVWAFVGVVAIVRDWLQSRKGES